MKQPDDLVRLRTEYEDRIRRLTKSNTYSLFNLSNLFIIQQRQRAVLALLKRQEFDDFSSLRILEVGCGEGGVLTEYLGFGALPENLAGIDILEDRLKSAHRYLPSSLLAQADGAHLPFPSHRFDLVLQYTAISSVLDAEIRRQMFTEMLRVLNSNGMILSYDFWFNPLNKQTRGLRLNEIRESVPGCNIEYKKITLAPPISRKLVPVSWLLSALIEKITLFNTHYLTIIRPRN